MPEVRIIIPEDLDRALDSLIKAGFAGNKAELARSALTHFLSTIPTQLPKGYDVETAFSPDGRVFQLEYADESTQRGGTIVGICSSEGIVLAKELLKLDPLMKIPNPFIRIFKLHEQVGMMYAGLLADGYLVVEEAIGQTKSLEEAKNLDVETLAKKLALFMQAFGQRKDVRPLGVSLILAGIDSEDTPRLFLLDGCSGAYEYKACAVGIGGEESKGILKGGYRDNLSLEEATALAVKAALREEKKPESILLATINAETKKFREITLGEKEQMWKKIFS